MRVFVETERLILREIVPQDAEALFALDSDPEVHRYLGNKPLESLEQATATIDFIRKQYIDNGIGRWAIEEKEHNNFVGWSGLKYGKEITNHHINYYDLGYRLMKRYWGYGYATEAAIASLAYGFSKLKLLEIYAMADVENKESNHVLTKVGCKQIETFGHEGKMHYWYQIEKKDWEKQEHEVREV